MEFAQFELMQKKRKDAHDRNDLMEYWLYDALICHDLDMPDTAKESLDNARKVASE